MANSQICWFVDVVKEALANAPPHEVEYAAGNDWQGGSGPFTNCRTDMPTVKHYGEF